VVAHDPEGVAHELGHGQLAGEVAAGLELLDDLAGVVDRLAVELGLDLGQLGDVPGAGVLAKNSLRRPRLRSWGGSVAGSASHPARAARPSR